MTVLMDKESFIEKMVALLKESGKTMAWHPNICDNLLLNILIVNFFRSYNI